MDRSGWHAISWVDQELAGSTFKDERLGRRLRKLLVQLADAVGAPIPLACQDWANTKAAYRFLSNEAVSEAEILAGHFHATRSRVAAAAGLILVLQDTSEFSYQRAQPERIGTITTAPSRREADPAQDAHRLWPADARQPGGDDRGAAAGAGGDQVLDAGQVQGNERAQASGQPDPGADRGQGEHPLLAGEHAPSHRPPRRPGPAGPHRRP